MDKLIEVSDLTQVAKDYNAKVDKIQQELDPIVSDWGSITGCAARLEELVWQKQS